MKVERIYLAGLVRWRTLVVGEPKVNEATHFAFVFSDQDVWMLCGERLTPAYLSLADRDVVLNLVGHLTYVGVLPRGYMDLRY